jgi:diadenylate cyclase
LTPINIIDIVIVAYFFYKTMMMIRETRAVQLLKGLMVLLIFAFISNIFRLQTVSFLLSQIQTVLIVAVPIVFQPELRRALERLGQGRFFSHLTINPEDFQKMVEEIIRAVKILSKNQVGALLIIERETGLKDYIESGVILDAAISSELIENIFFPKAALHDGATIIRGNRIVAAGCFLPLSENPNISKSLGTRHRAGLGLSEQSDAFIIIISEETGVISVVEEGRMTRYLNDVALREMLMEHFQSKEEKSNGFSLANPWGFWRNKK